MTTKEKLENMLIEKGFIVDLLWGVQGYWRKPQQDVMRWEAQCRRLDKPKMTIHIGSWNTMTECVRRGFSLRQADEFGSKFDLQADANDRKTKS